MKIDPRILVSVLFVSAMIIGCDDDADDTPSSGDADTDTDIDTDTDSSDPDRCGEGLALPPDAYFPEGSTIDPDGHIYIGTIGSGAIYKFNNGAQPAEVLVQGEPFTAVVGILFDSERSILWACNALADLSTASLVGVNPEDGSIVVSHVIPNAPPVVCNDLAIDSEGNIYASDSPSHTILRLPTENAMVADSLEIWSADPILGENNTEGGLGVNGLVVSDGAIYTVNYETGDLYRIPINDDGSAGAAETLTVTQGVLSGGDGIERRDDGSLLIVENLSGEITRVDIDGSTAALTKITTVPEAPATCIVDESENIAWVVQNQDALNNQNPNIPFCVAKISLQPELDPSEANGFVAQHAENQHELYTDVVIEATQEQVWTVLTDFENMPNWSSSLQGIDGDFTDGGEVTTYYLNNGQVVPVPHVLILEDGVSFGWSEDAGPFAPGIVDNHHYRVAESDGIRTRFIQSDMFVGTSAAMTTEELANLLLPLYQSFNSELKAEVEGQYAK